MAELQAALHGAMENEVRGSNRGEDRKADPEGVEIVIPGAPIAKGRARFVMRNGNMRSFTPDKTVNYETLVKVQAHAAMAGRAPIDGPIAIDMIAYYPIPSSWSQKRRIEAINGRVIPTVKPDVDNVTKAILDAMNLIVYQDDSQVSDLTIKKRYSDTPMVMLFLRSACSR